MHKIILFVFTKNPDDGATDDTVPLIVEESDLVTDNLEPLPLWRKICFAVGGAPYQTTNTVINFFISIFLLEVAKV